MCVVLKEWILSIKFVDPDGDNKTPRLEVVTAVELRIWLSWGVQLHRGYERDTARKVGKC
jgi:hypothetical protein